MYCPLNLSIIALLVCCLEAKMNVVLRQCRMSYELLLVDLVLKGLIGTANSLPSNRNSSSKIKKKVNCPKMKLGYEGFQTE